MNSIIIHMSCQQGRTFLRTGVTTFFSHLCLGSFDFDMEGVPRMTEEERAGREKEVAEIVGLLETLSENADDDD